MTTNKKLKRRIEPVLEKKSPVREQFFKILIVCEGENTEKSYFDFFKKMIFEKYKKGGNLIIKPFCSGNPKGIIKKALDENYNRFDIKWCVFDKDSISDNDFNSAINVAKNRGLKVAYSNQAFEYWLFLHLNDHQGNSLERIRYSDLINNELQSIKPGVIYGVDKIVTWEFFRILSKRRQDAIIRSKRILMNLNNLNPAKAESSTTVHVLVEDLLLEKKKFKKSQSRL